MADDEMEARIKRLEKELADVKAVQEADRELERDAQRGPVPGLSRLRSVKRNDGYLDQGDDNDDES